MTDIAPWTAPWRVVTVDALPCMRLRVDFGDGTSGEVDLASFLGKEEVRGTVFEALREAEFFARAGVVDGAVQWPNEAWLPTRCTTRSDRAAAGCCPEEPRFPKVRAQPLEETKSGRPTCRGPEAQGQTGQHPNRS